MILWAKLWCWKFYISLKCESCVTCFLLETTALDSKRPPPSASVAIKRHMGNFRARNLYLVYSENDSWKSLKFTFNFQLSFSYMHGWFQRVVMHMPSGKHTRHMASKSSAGNLSGNMGFWLSPQVLSHKILSGITAQIHLTVSRHCSFALYYVVYIHLSH